MPRCHALAPFFAADYDMMPFSLMPPLMLLPLIFAAMLLFSMLRCRCCLFRCRRDIFALTPPLIRDAAPLIQCCTFLHADAGFSYAMLR